MSIWNPIQAHWDRQKRESLKKTLLALLKTNLRSVNDAMDIAGLDLYKTSDKSGLLGPVIEEICRENKQYSLIMFASNPCIVLTQGVDSLNSDFREKNLSEGLIKRGG